MKKAVLIIVSIISLVCLSCKAQQLNPSITNTYSLKYKLENLNNIKTEAIHNFALLTYNNCYHHQFPKLTN
jgi:hypothetical protein